MKKTKKVLVTAIVATALIGLTACGGGGGNAGAVEFTDDATGDLKAWGFENTDDVGQARLDYAEG